MKAKPDKQHHIPIIDCLGCGKKNMPLSTKGPFIKKGFPEIWISYCPNCERVPFDESEIKGYVSVAELEAMGWTRGSTKQRKIK